MGATWMTKYGARRVRHEPPTLEEALVAAEGLTTDTDQQLQIAAQLMDLPFEEVQLAGRRILAARSRPSRAAPVRSVVGPNQNTVVVERRVSRRATTTRATGTVAARR